MATTASHVWRPSASRLQVIDGFVPGPRGVPARPPAVLKWPAKDPADVLDYQFDIGPVLSGNDGDAISTLDVTITPSGSSDLSLLSAAADGSRAVLWLQGGHVNTVYTVTITISTEAGRAITRSILLPVVAYVSTGGSSAILILEDGTSLVDADGNALVLGTGGV